MNLYDIIRSKFKKDHKSEPFVYKYNYSYFPPIPLVEQFPGTGLEFGWAARVAILQFRITLNLLAVVFEEDQPNLVAELEDVERAIGDHRPIKTLIELCDFVEKMCKTRPDVLGDFITPFKDIVLKMQGKRGIFGAMKIFFAVGNQLDEKDNNLALDFWLFFEALQNAVLAKVDNKHMANFEEYEAMFRHLPLPAIAKTWQQDASFADMRVAGPNPEILERLSEPMANFPVTNSHYQQVMGADDDLNLAMAAGRVYVGNYAIFSSVLTGSFPAEKKYMGAPIALFAVPKNGDQRLKVVAIQCGQTPGEEFPLITPPTLGDKDENARNKWLMAKTFFQVSDGNYHEAVAHLGRTHLLISPFDIATRNILKDTHPVGRLLLPHFQATFNINNAAQGSLIAAEGVIDQIMGGTIDISRVYGAVGAQSYALNFDKSFQPLTFKQRGVDDPKCLPYYPYRDCSLLIWDAIKEWVREYVFLHYHNEMDPEKDELLQSWYQNLVAQDGGRIASFGEDGALRSRAYLIDSLTMIIFTASAGHAAVNFPQQTIMSYAPAMPLAAYTPPPSATGFYTQKDVMAMFPPLRQTVLQINTGTLLGGIYYTLLGKIPDDYFDSKGTAVLKRFQDRLEELEVEIKQRFPEYPYLLPSKIPISINI